MRRYIFGGTYVEIVRSVRKTIFIFNDTSHLLDVIKKAVVFVSKQVKKEFNIFYDNINIVGHQVGFFYEKEKCTTIRYIGKIVKVIKLFITWKRVRMPQFSLQSQYVIVRIL